MKHFKLNQRVRVNSSNDNENYEIFKNEVLIITNVARNRDEHQGYDDSLKGQYLYDLKTESGKEVNCSLYDYELQPA
jgi:hypothetical protein